MLKAIRHSVGSNCSTRHSVRFGKVAGVVIFVLGGPLLILPACRKATTEPSPHTSDTPTQSENTSLQTNMHFENVSQQLRIDGIYRNGEAAGHYGIIETVGGGAAWLDYDKDGRMDALIAGGGEFAPDDKMHGLAPSLWRQTAGRFENVSDLGGLQIPSYPYNHAVIVADYDEDGFPDALITGYGGLSLLRNQGDGSFRRVAGEAGAEDSGWSCGAAFGDLNQDGWLDLFVVNYVNWSLTNNPPWPGPRPGLREVCPPRSFQGISDRLWLSDGAGQFIDHTQASGLEADGKGLGVVMADVDLDGDLDIYVGNDGVPNFLYLNDGQGNLRNIALPSGVSMGENGSADGSMGVDVGDFDNDGLPDIWVANYEAETFALYRNLGKGLFRHDSRKLGIGAVGGLYVGWGTCFGDFDQDGDEDLFATNGHVMRYPLEAPVRQKPLLLQNESGRRFMNIAAAAGDYMSTPQMGRGLASGDFDEDGDLDLLIVHINEPVALLRNESLGNHHWLTVELVGTKSPRDAIGARVRLESEIGVMTRQRKGGGSFASSHDPRLFFGLGQCRRIDALDVVWPSGRTQRFADLSADQHLRIIEPSGD